MFAVGGLLLLAAMGFAVGGMMSGDDPPDAAAGTADANDDIAEPEGDDTLSGAESGSLSEMLFGTEADDPIGSGTRDDTVAGGDGDDWLEGGDGDDSLDGGHGRDTLDGGGGNDALRLRAGDMGSGGEGSDTFSLSGAGGAADTATEDLPYITDFQPGVDRLILEFDADGPDDPDITFDTDSVENGTLVMLDGVAVAMLEGVGPLAPDDIELQTVVEGDATDNAPSGEETGLPSNLGDPAPGETIEGSAEDATLSGGPGDDTLDGYTGDDLLDGGTGDDLLRGREGMDSLFGSGGNDAITGGVGADLLEGGIENDALFGNEGDDQISGGDGADEAYGDQGNDSISGGDGTDFLAGGDGQDSLSGGAHSDLLFGNDGDDSLSGDGGNDFLQGGFGADTLDGGDGNDRLDGTFVAGDAAFGPFDEDVGDVLNGGQGDDVIIVGAQDIATGGDGADTLITGSFIESEAVDGMVTDFDPSQDVIEVMYDPALDPNPVITVEPFADGTGAHVLFDGQVVLSVTGGQGLDAGMIELLEVAFDPEAEPA